VKRTSKLDRVAHSLARQTLFKSSRSLLHSYERSKYRRLPHWADFLKYNFSGILLARTCRVIKTNSVSEPHNILCWIILPPKSNIAKFLLLLRYQEH